MSGTAAAATPVRRVATAFGVVFLLVGVLGFVPGITTNFDQLEFAGHHSEAKLLGIFGVSVLHNAVHLLFGLAGLVLARTSTGAVQFLIGGGAIYLVLAAYGAVIDHHSDLNFVPIDKADNFLHLGLGLAMVGLGVGLKKTAGNRY